MQGRPFSVIAKECAGILNSVLEGAIQTPQELTSAWPADAQSYSVLDDACDSVYEYWLLQPDYKSVLLACISVLQSASDNPEETLVRMERAIDES